VHDRDRDTLVNSFNSILGRLDIVTANIVAGVTGLVVVAVAVGATGVAVDGLGTLSLVSRDTTN
jgi:hypothetical protein